MGTSATPATNTSFWTEAINAATFEIESWNPSTNGIHREGPEAMTESSGMYPSGVLLQTLSGLQGLHVTWNQGRWRFHCLTALLPTTPPGNERLNWKKFASLSFSLFWNVHFIPFWSVLLKQVRSPLHGLTVLCDSSYFLSHCACCNAGLRQEPSKFQLLEIADLHHSIYSITPVS